MYNYVAGSLNRCTTADTTERAFKIQTVVYVVT